MGKQDPINFFNFGREGLLHLKAAGSGPARSLLGWLVEWIGNTWKTWCVLWRGMDTLRDGMVCCISVAGG